MKLLPNEEKIISSNENKVILTNQRIHMIASEWGKSFSTYIFLENISAIELKYRSNIIFLFLGIISVFGGLLAGADVLTIGVIVGGIFLAIWWYTRTHIISILADNGSSLNFMVQGMGDDKINDFIYNVSLAKQNRINNLFKVLN